MLSIHGTEANSIFELIGTDENDITKSIAWSFAKCPQFLVYILQFLFGDINVDEDNISIFYQKYDDKTGITDIEITDEKNFYVIVEAKRGWILPGHEQLERYSGREEFVKSTIANKALVSMSECSLLYADTYLSSQTSNGIPVRHVSWQKLYDATFEVYAHLNNQQKHLLGELRRYMEKIMTMQPKHSNWVFVVSLSSGMFNDSLSWRDIVNKHRKYFHPVGNKWPPEPPNYIAFRYDSKLQSIHHIESYVVSMNLHNEIPEIESKEENQPLYVYSLGPAIVPSKTVITGNIYPSGHVWAMIDTLLTADSISEARDISQARANS